MSKLRRLDSTDATFWKTLEALLAWDGVADKAVRDVVDTVLADVRERGDAAVVEYTQRFDRHPATAMDQLEVGPDLLQQALDNLPAEQRDALEQAAQGFQGP